MALFASVNVHVCFLDFETLFPIPLFGHIENEKKACRKERGKELLFQLEFPLPSGENQTLRSAHKEL